MYGEHFGIRAETIIVNASSDYALLRSRAYSELLGLAAWVVSESELREPPQRICLGSDEFVLLRMDDFDSLEGAIPNPSDLYLAWCDEKRVEARGVWLECSDTSGPFVVFPDSDMAVREATSLNPSSKADRHRLIENGVVERRDPHRSKFTRAYMFDSPAAAARAISGYNAGNEFWVNREGNRMPLSRRKRR